MIIGIKRQSRIKRLRSVDVDAITLTILEGKLVMPKHIILQNLLENTIIQSGAL
jgi:hypothetical protein